MRQSAMGDGMKKLLLAGVSVSALMAGLPADAADLGTRPVYKAVPVAAPVPIFSWSGCYIGAHVGFGWGRKDFTDPAGRNSVTVTTTTFSAPTIVSDLEAFFVGFDQPDTLRVDPDGFLGGGQVGCDYQFAPNWLIGVEGEGAGADISGSALDPFFPSSFGKTFHAKTEWLASVTGRVGWVWDRWLLYAKGGVAWAGDKYHVDEAGVFYNASETRTGWTVGGGIEFAFWQNWSAFVEYDFYEFGRRDLAFVCTFSDGTSCGLTGPVSIRQDINAVKFGINYRFNWGKGKAPVVAKY
jgi:outer membrane immunogenic protein